MMNRNNSFFDYFNIEIYDQIYGRAIAESAASRAKGMTHLKDYEALASIALNLKPKLIFEIGTYLGVTSDFFLELLPECRVVSIAYPNNKNSVFNKFFNSKFNNSDLSEKRIGSLVQDNRRNRFTQLLGDSHELIAENLIEKYGFFDLVFIDGDHSREGVKLDTELARKIISHNGAICWHDANPKKKYIGVRDFLEKDLSLNIIATEDTYVGGIAYWRNDNTL
jgi:predicted O-methyltransferase YrrM